VAFGTIDRPEIGTSANRIAANNYKDIWLNCNLIDMVLDDLGTL